MYIQYVWIIHIMCVQCRWIIHIVCGVTVCVWVVWLVYWVVVSEYARGGLSLVPRGKEVEGGVFPIGVVYACAVGLVRGFLLLGVRTGW